MAFEKHNSERFIYLADDDSDDRDFFADALLEINPKVILRQIQDGIYLMDALLGLSNTEIPEFIFLDINMPGKSGFVCLKEIRNLTGSLKKVNIIMLSTSSDPENIQKAWEMGATCYVVKPSSFEKLKSLLKEILTMDFGTIEEKKKILLL